MKIQINLPQACELRIGEIAKQANGSVWLQCGQSVVLASICSDFEAKSDEDFLPLTVQYIEKSYAAGKIPGGFVKREGKPSDFETLTARIIDRTLRPLFPKGYNYPTQITIFVLSSDGICDLQTLALNAASIALYLSDIPVSEPACALRIGRIQGEYVVNPTLQQLQESTLDLFVSGVREDILMIEMRSLASRSESVGALAESCGVLGVDMLQQSPNHNPNELSEEELLQALELAQNHLKEVALQIETLTLHAKESVQVSLVSDIFSEEVLEYIRHHYKKQIEEALVLMAKSERSQALNRLLETIMQQEEVCTKEWSKEVVEAMLMRAKREKVREMILLHHKRADGRTPKEVRPISIQTNLLPMAHSSALFTRGQTQALVVGTLGGDIDAQSYELLNDKKSQKETFMLHYNFPPFSVGEVGMIGSPGRRELGHGNLAKRALEPSIINKNTQTIRLVSEILESNGSSSMASVCGGSLALCAAGIDVSNLVAGVAMGLIQEGEKYVILTDIMGLEDHDGDMDFKVAGTHLGITAMQMDIKLGGLSMQILKEALLQAKEGREHILEIMEQARKEIVINEEILPSLQIFSINPSKIVDVIGQAGKTIKEIIDKFGVAVDLNRDNGEVKVSGENKEKVTQAKDYILSITNENGSIQKVRMGDLYKAGEKYNGKVKSIVDFGAFIELPKGGDGLLHVSRIVSKRGDRINSVFNEGDFVQVEILSVNKNKLELAYLGKA